MNVLLKRAQYLLQTGGLVNLLRQSCTFLTGYVFLWRHYYLYEHTFTERNESAFLPRIRDFAFEIISTNEQADEIAATRPDFRSFIINARTGLEKGAVAFCFFINGELAHIGWAALNEGAKNTFDSLPYRVNFSQNQAATGGTWTNPRYRGKGLMVYGYFKRHQYLIKEGVKSSRNAVDVGNVISQKALARFSPRIYAKASYLKVLGWKSWKETPVT